MENAIITMLPKESFLFEYSPSHLFFFFFLQNLPLFYILFLNVFIVSMSICYVQTCPLNVSLVGSAIPLILFNFLSPLLRTIYATKDAALTYTTWFLNDWVDGYPVKMQISVNININQYLWITICEDLF